MSDAPDAAPREILAVPAELAGMRLDLALVQLWPSFSRTRLKAVLSAGGVRLDDAVVLRASTPVSAGSRIELDLQRLEPVLRASAPGPGFRVVFEDDHLAVVDKPAGMLVHPSPSVRGGTLCELAEARWGALPSLQGSERPGVVHRLDAGTSGLLVLGKREPALKELMRQFREREVEKTYLALVWGEPRFDTGFIEAPIARSAATPNRMDVAAPGTGRAASTYYEVRERLGSATLVACFPRTGRTHQIRVHLASLGHPLLGDALYRLRGTPSAKLPAQAPLPARHALHAAGLAFTHPVSGGRVAFEAPLPEDLAGLLACLRGAAGSR